MPVRRSDLRFSSLNPLFALSILIVRANTGHSSHKEQDFSHSEFTARTSHNDPQPSARATVQQPARLTTQELHSKLPWRRDPRPTSTINPDSEIYGLAVVLVAIAAFWKYYVRDSFSPGPHNNYRPARPLTPLAISLLAAHSTMSFFGMGRPQPSSAEKIAAVEQEMKLMASMHTRYDFLLSQSQLSTVT